MSLSLDIKKRFPTFTLEVALEAGAETLGFLGASGCGKSLTMRCIAGLETPDEGRIVVNGTTFFDSSAKVNLRPQQRKTALLFQNYMLFPNLTVAENIAAGLPKNTSKSKAKALVERQLELFGLRGFGKRYPIRLSGGQQQRVALARMLVAKPGILMLDEPFSALDAHLKGNLEQDMLSLFEAFEGTILYVSHDIDEAFRFCDRVAIIDHGRLAEVASTQEITAHPSTLATLKVSGVKNISPVRFIDAHTIEALSWGLQLTTTQEIPPAVTHVGFHASSLTEASDQPTNIFSCEVTRVSEARFERTLLLNTPNSQEPLQWQISKLAIPPQETSQRGECVKVHIPPDQIHLVTC